MQYQHSILNQVVQPWYQEVITLSDMYVHDIYWFLSLGHDSSIRLWDIAMNKNCIQEFSAHRRKGHEGVLSVQYHKSFPWMVSGGADGIVKIYHHGHH